KVGPGVDCISESQSHLASGKRGQRCGLPGELGLARLPVARLRPEIDRGATVVRGDQRACDLICRSNTEAAPEGQFARGADQERARSGKELVLGGCGMRKMK